MKVKYLSGKRKDEVLDIEEVQAKSLIEDGIVEAVEASPLEVAIKNLDSKIEQMVDVATTKKLEHITDSVGNYVSVGPARETLDPTGGFKSSSHFYGDVIKAAIAQKQGGEAPASIKRWEDISRKNPSGAAEGTNNIGGYAVPTIYETELFQIDADVPSFQDLCFKVPMQTAFTKIPVVRQYNRANSTPTAGIVAADTAEGATPTNTVINWEQLSLTLGKIQINAPVTNELMDDNNVALGAVIGRTAGRQINRKINGGILNGGSTAFTSIINHASVVSVAPATHNTVSAADVLGMYAAYDHDDDEFSSAVWFAHPTALPSIGAMQTSNGFPLYFPPGGMREDAYGNLMGRPLIPSGWLNPINSGLNGSLLLVNPKKYVIGHKDGVRSAMSPHVLFNSDELMFRFTIRLTGKPALSGPVTLEDNQTVVSSFVQLGYKSGTP